MTDPRPLITPPADVAQRTMIEVLARGPLYREVRLVNRGPLCPSAILYVQSRAEPGEPDNAMDRSPHIAALVSGQWTDPVRLFCSGKAGTRHITRAEYERAMAEIAANLRANRYEPRLFPMKAVEIDQMEIPFSERCR